MKLKEKVSWLMGTVQRTLFPHLDECLTAPLTAQEKRLVTIRRCFRDVGLLCSSGVREPEHPSIQSSDVMIMQVLHGPHCQGTDIIRHGTTRQGKQRYRCQENACKGRTFLLDYTYAGHSAGVKQ